MTNPGEHPDDNTDFLILEKLKENSKVYTDLNTDFRFLDITIFLQARRILSLDGYVACLYVL